MMSLPENGTESQSNCALSCCFCWCCLSTVVVLNTTTKLIIDFKEIVTKVCFHSLEPRKLADNYISDRVRVSAN